MQIPITAIGLGLLVAFSATAVRAGTQVATTQAANTPVGTLQATPIDLALHPATDAQLAPPLSPIDMSLQSASSELQYVARWVLDSGDNAGLPFLLIDKVNAQVFVFSPAGKVLGSSPALLGLARGDRLLAPNDAPMSAMSPQVRITPAGRFVSRLAIDSHGKELLVLDYDASISLHAVIKGTPKERRAERLKSASSEDNRISFGCINVPVPFYQTVVSPAFTPSKGIVYVLPETSPASAMFGLPTGGAAVSGAEQSSPALNTRAVQSAAPGAK